MFGILTNHNQNLRNSLFCFQIDIWSYWSAGHTGHTIFYVAR